MVMLYYTLLQELLTRHKSTVAEFLSKNYDWVMCLFFLEAYHDFTLRLQSFFFHLLYLHFIVKFI